MIASRRKLLIDVISRFHPVIGHYNPVMWILWVVAIFFVIENIYAFTIGEPIFGSYIFEVLAMLMVWSILLIINFSEAVISRSIKRVAARVNRYRNDSEVEKLRASFLNEGSSITKNLDAIFATNITATDITYRVKVADLEDGDIIILRKGDIAPVSGEVIAGVSYIDESSATGESQPFVVGADYPRSQINSGGKLLSDQVLLRCTIQSKVEEVEEVVAEIARAKETYRNEKLLGTYLLLISIAFIMQILSLKILSHADDYFIPNAFFIIMLVCILPTTVGSLITSVNLATFRLLLAARVVVKSTAALEKLCDITTIVFDKTGILTTGSRKVIKCIPMDPDYSSEFFSSLYLSSILDETPEGREVVKYLSNKGYKYHESDHLKNYEVIEFDSHRRISGCTYHGGSIVKGALDSLLKQDLIDIDAKHNIDAISKITKAQGVGLSIMIIVKNGDILGYIGLRDEILFGMKDMLKKLAISGYELKVLTGDNRDVAKAVAEELDIQNAEIIAESNEETKAEHISAMQAVGKRVLYIGDSNNDSKPLLTADIGFTFGRAPREIQRCADIVDYSNNPTNLYKIIHETKNSMKVKGGLNLFSIFTDLAKYIIIIPTIYASLLPQFSAWNFLHFYSKETVLLASLTFNTLVILLLMPLVIPSNQRKSIGLFRLSVRQNFLVFMSMGVILPFIMIKLLDYVFSLLI